MNKANLILVTGIERSGTTIIARLLKLYAEKVYFGECSKMLENLHIKDLTEKYLQHNKFDPLGQYPLPNNDSIPIPVDWGINIERPFEKAGWNPEMPIIYKSNRSFLFWRVWHVNYPKAKWIIVRRRTGDIVDSCVKTGYMKAFKDSVLREKFNVSTEEEGWLQWVREQEIKLENMIKEEIDYMSIWPERIADGDYSQVYKMLQWLGLPWDSRIVSEISPLLLKNTNKRKGVYENVSDIGA